MQQRVYQMKFRNL